MERCMHTRCVPHFRHQKNLRLFAHVQMKSNLMASMSGQTRLHQSLERARLGHGPSVGQWLELPGYSLARTVATLGEDVCYF
jgi:hypothetical protein